MVSYLLSPVLKLNMVIWKAGSRHFQRLITPARFGSDGRQVSGAAPA
jgi:hypothetical protein